MRKFLITLVLVLFFYLAGLYRSSSVMIFISAFLVFLTILGILSKYLARRLEIGVEPERNKVSKGSTLTVALTAANRSRVPVMRFEVRLKIWNRGTSKAEVKKIQGYVPGRGTARIEAEISPKHCGVLEICTEKRKYGSRCAFSSDRERHRLPVKRWYFRRGMRCSFSWIACLLAWRRKQGKTGPECSRLKSIRYRLTAPETDFGIFTGS